MKQKKTKKLRRQLAEPLLVVFFLLWCGMVGLLYTNACQAVEHLSEEVRSNARTELQEQWEFYERNTAAGLGAQAEHILVDNLSSAAGLLGTVDGGMAFFVRDSAGNEMQSQIAWGYGHEDGIDIGERWHLRFDKGLDDAGQLAFAEWLLAHRENWSFDVYPADSDRFADLAPEDRPDGTYARVTGVELPGRAIDVQKIELIHPDGTVETMIETQLAGTSTITLDLKYMRIQSVLLPAWSNRGDGFVDMERRLANLRAARIRAQGGEPETDAQVWRTGMSGGDGVTMRFVAGVYQPTPYVLRTNGITWLALLGLTALAALLLSARLSKRVTRPVEALCREAAQGQCREDGPVAELNTLAAAFNTAQRQVQAQLQRERDFTRAAAHELKTPLAVLRAHAEALQEDIIPEKRAAYLDVLLEESDRMTDLTGRLLALSRLESGSLQARAPVELSALIEEVFERLALPMGSKRLHLTCDLMRLTVSADRAAICEVIENLALNAIRHCPDGGALHAALREADGFARFTLDNDGAPIDADDLPHLWEPFYRADKSRSREHGGSGLGLAIVHAAVTAHGGSCSVENIENGVRFGIALPVQDQATNTDENSACRAE